METAGGRQVALRTTASGRPGCLHCWASAPRASACLSLIIRYEKVHCRRHSVVGAAGLGRATVAGEVFDWDWAWDWGGGDGDGDGGRCGPGSVWVPLVCAGRGGAGERCWPACSTFSAIGPKWFSVRPRHIHANSDEPVFPTQSSPKKSTFVNGSYPGWLKRKGFVTIG